MEADIHGCRIRTRAPAETFLCFLQSFPFFGCLAWHVGISVPRPGLEHMPLAVQVWCFNNWTSREGPGDIILPLALIANSPPPSWKAAVGKKPTYSLGHPLLDHG